MYNMVILSIKHYIILYWTIYETSFDVNKKQEVSISLIYRHITFLLTTKKRIIQNSAESSHLCWTSNTHMTEIAWIGLVA